MPYRERAAAIDSDSRRYLVSSDPFWPTIDLALLREQLQLPADVSDTRLEVAARVSVTRAAKEFCGWRLELRKQGYRNLSELSGDGKGPSLAQLYRRAVQEATRLELSRHFAPKQGTPRHASCRLRRSV